MNDVKQENNMAIKNLPLQAPLAAAANALRLHRESIEAWLQQQWALTPPPFYGSVDLRNAQFKLAPVDMNLFPAGFNNLAPQSFSHATAVFRRTLENLAPNARQILLIPENHTRNNFYWENIKVLVQLLMAAGCTVRLGSWREEMLMQSVTLDAGQTIAVAALVREGDQLTLADGFTPEAILLNNDLSDGVPEILQGLTQILLPPTALGWSTRLKSQHFQHYADLTQELATLIKIDPWTLTPLFRQCGKVDFMQREGEACLIHHAEQLLAAIQQKYQEYHISHKPFVILKADAGTYGMAVMTIRSVDDIHALNRKQRSHMAKTKGGQTVHQVIVQEGVYSFESVEAGTVAEPVIYLSGAELLGGFYRVHRTRGNDENLNSPGMYFAAAAFAEQWQTFYEYSVVARLSMLAAAREIAASATQKGAL